MQTPRWMLKVFDAVPYILLFCCGVGVGIFGTVTVLIVVRMH